VGSISNSRVGDYGLIFKVEGLGFEVRLEGSGLERADLGGCAELVYFATIDPSRSIYGAGTDLTGWEFNMITLQGYPTHKKPPTLGPCSGP